jgi:hypothetical protein
MEKSEPEETPEVSERIGRYTRAERQHFDELHGPGTAIALESIRKNAGVRVTITRHSPSDPTPPLIRD